MTVPMKSKQNKAECPRDEDNTGEGQDEIFWMATIEERMCVLHMASKCCLHVFLYLITKKGRDSKMESRKYFFYGIHKKGKNKAVLEHLKSQGLYQV